MSFFRTLCIAALISAAPQLTPAAPAVAPKTIGHIEAVVNFCSRIDSESADKYKELGKQVVRDMSEKELADARNTDEYKESYEAIITELEKAPADKATKGCRSMLKADT